MKRHILTAIMLCFFACSNEQVNPADNTVHLAGSIANSKGLGGDTGPACYWKDGTCTLLAGDSIFSRTTSLHVDGNSVLIGGWKLDENSMPVGRRWQDGKETVINGAFGTTTLVASHKNNLFGVWDEGISGWVFNKNGTSQSIVDTATNIAPTGLAVLGDDMYISGFSSYHDGSVPDAPTDYHAQCWKNGQLIFRENKTSGAYAIFIHQNNIYMAGTQGNVACYWKNGARVDLTDGSAPSIAKSIFVTDAHVYVSGMLNYQAVYWKDGAIIPLTTEGTNSMANSIFVHGEDVHVGGYEHRYPAYWKNDVKQNIANQDKPGEIKFVVVGSN